MKTTILLTVVITVLACFQIINFALSADNNKRLIEMCVYSLAVNSDMTADEVIGICRDGYKE
jgi:hypothetical protein